MAVNTRELSHTKFYKSQIRNTKYPKTTLQESIAYISHDYLAAIHNIYLRGVVSLRVGTRAEPDFVILDKAKGSFRFVEIKKGIWSVSARKTLSYVQKRLALVDYGTETLSELTKVARPIEVEYLNQALVETLLGSTGKYVLGRVLSVVNRIARGADWPLDKIEVCYVHDSEVQDWEYVLLLLVFTCDFDTADRYLHELYDQIDVLNSKLSAEEQEILQRMIFFDIEAKASLSST